MEKGESENASVDTQEKKETQEVADLEAENKKLKEEIAIREDLEYSDNCYWMQKGEKKDGPFCSRCWDKEKLLIRMHPMGNKAYSRCPSCDNSVQVLPDNSSNLVHRNRAEDIGW